MIALALNQVPHGHERRTGKSKRLPCRGPVAWAEAVEIDPVSEHGDAIRCDTKVDHRILERLTDRDHAVGLGSGVPDQPSRISKLWNEIDVRAAGRDYNRKPEGLREPDRRYPVGIEIMGIDQIDGIALSAGCAPMTVSAYGRACKG